MDGIDLRELALADWRRRITVLFQEPVHYHDTVAYNIACGDLAVVADEAAIAGVVGGHFSGWFLSGFFVGGILGRGGIGFCFHSEADASGN